MRTRLLEARLQEGVLHRREEPGQPGSLLLGVHRERAWPLLFFLGEKRVAELQHPRRAFRRD